MMPKTAGVHKNIAESEGICGIECASAVVLTAVGVRAATLFASVSGTGRCPLCHH